LIPILKYVTNSGNIYKVREGTYYYSTKLRTILQVIPEQGDVFKQCGNKLTRFNGSDLTVNMRALREQLGSTHCFTVNPKTIRCNVRKPKPKAIAKEPQTQEEWDDVGNPHPKTIKKPRPKTIVVRKPKTDEFDSFEDYI
jgi:hypothetical protein